MAQSERYQRIADAPLPSARGHNLVWGENSSWLDDVPDVLV